MPTDTIPWNGKDRRTPDRWRERETASRIAVAGELSGLTLTTVTTVAELDSLSTAYEQLNRVSSLALPFTLHDWHRAWCEHFLVATRSIQDSILIYVVRTATGRCVAIVPMIRTRRSIGPFKVSSLQLLGADAALTEIRMPLIAPGFHAEIGHIMQRQLAALGRWDWIHWLAVTATFSHALTDAVDLRWQQPLADYVLDLPNDWETFRKTRRRNVRESLRHCYNSLKRDNLEFSLIVLSRPEEMQPAIDEFLPLHAMRAGLAGTIRHPDHFKSATAQEFLRDVCARLTARNVTRIFQLVVNGQVVATRIGFVISGNLYLYYSGYDTAWARYGVMTTTLAEVIKWAIAAGVHTINLSTGTDIGKTRWSPREILIPQLLQVDRFFWSKVARSVYEYAMGSELTTRWLAKMLGRFRRKTS